MRQSITLEQEILIKLETEKIDNIFVVKLWVCEDAIVDKEDAGLEEYQRDSQLI